MSKDKQLPTSEPQGQQEQDNHANNLNRNNDQFWKSRGYQERPKDWKTTVPESKHPQSRDE